VMYAGRLVETGTVWDVFDAPKHPYTQGLLGSLLTAQNLGQRAYAIPGSPPSVLGRPEGCPFAPRCGSALRTEACGDARPALIELAAGHAAACTPLTMMVDA
jgi:peptide/nickel transport system ATP-binding protein